MLFLFIGIITVILVVGMFVVLYCEEKDKSYRRESGLPPKRYHDITDCDSVDVYLLIGGQTPQRRK